MNERQAKNTDGQTPRSAKEEERASKLGSAPSDTCSNEAVRVRRFPFRRISRNALQPLLRNPCGIERCTERSLRSPLGGRPHGSTRNVHPSEWCHASRGHSRAIRHTAWDAGGIEPPHARMRDHQMRPHARRVAPWVWRHGTRTHTSMLSAMHGGGSVSTHGEVGVTGSRSYISPTPYAA